MRELLQMINQDRPSGYIARLLGVLGGSIDAAAGAMSLLLLVISLVTIAVSYGLAERLLKRRRLA